jgi:hypothetical protein
MAPCPPIASGSIGPEMQIRRSSSGGAFRRHRLDIFLGVDFGGDVMKLFLRLSHHFPRLVAELVGAAYGRPEKRIQGCAHLWKISRHSDGRDAQNDARQQRHLEG